MKRFLAFSFAALGILAISDNKASAWSKTNFNIGLHISREAADNNFLWGLFRNGPHPFGNNPHAAAQHGHGYVPDNPHPYYNPNPHAGTPGTAPTLPPPGQSMPQAAAQYGTQYNPQTGTQPVGHWNSNNNYYYPTMNSNWNPPSYWYGNN